MKNALIVLLAVLGALFGVGCSVTPTPRGDRLNVLADSNLIDTEFALKRGFWVYTYPQPVVILREDGREVWYRMTAATGGAIGGRRLADYSRQYWGILHTGTQLRLVGITRYRDGVAYIAEVINPDNKELENELIEIYDGFEDYAKEGYPSGAPKLNEAFFRPLAGSKAVLKNAN